jgi:hypothetical protein
MELPAPFEMGLPSAPFDLPADFSINEVETAFIAQDLDGARATFQQRAARMVDVSRKTAELQELQTELERERQRHDRLRAERRARHDQARQADQRADDVRLLADAVVQLCRTLVPARAAEIEGKIKRGLATFRTAPKMTQEQLQREIRI